MPGKRIHASLVGSHLEADVIIINILINMYGKCNKPEDAQMLFDETLKLDIVVPSVLEKTFSSSSVKSGATKHGFWEL